MPNSTLHLPLVDTHTYLGVRLSYRAPEAATLKHRMKESWSAFNRLMPALRSNSLTIRQKLAIWRACVYATLMHGLDSTGLASTGPALLRKHVSKQVRRIAKSPSHITHETSSDLLLRHDISDPVADLFRRVNTRITKARAGPISLLQPARVHKRWSLLLHEITNHQPWHDPGQSALSRTATTSFQTTLCEVRPGTRAVACPICGVYFHSLKTMKQHVTLTHHKQQPKTQAPPKRTQQQLRNDFMQHAVNGLPTCSHCLWEFVSWPAFFQHFEHARCSVLQCCMQAAFAQTLSLPAIRHLSPAVNRLKPLRRADSTQNKLVPHWKRCCARCQLAIQTCCRNTTGVRLLSTFGPRRTLTIVLSAISGLPALSTSPDT